MFHVLHTGLARQYGVNGALVLSGIWDSVKKGQVEGPSRFLERTWVRSSYRMFTVAHPYLSQCQVQRALAHLVYQGVLVRDKLSKRQFDHSYWYTLTLYGRCLMESIENGQV